MELAEGLGWVGLERGAARGTCRMAGGCMVLLQHGNCLARALLPAHSGVNKGSARPDGPAEGPGTEIILGSLTQHWKGRGLGRHHCDTRQRQLCCRLHPQKLCNHSPALATIPVPNLQDYTTQATPGPSQGTACPVHLPGPREATGSWEGRECTGTGQAFRMGTPCPE